MKKKLYIFLCMVVGVILLLIIQRSAVALYIILSDTYFNYELMGAVQLQMVNIATLAVAVLVGLVYGNYLGHHWYPLVYGEDGDRIPKPQEEASKELSATKTVTIKPVRAVESKVKLKSELKDRSWDFDDLLNHDAPAVDSLGSSAPTISSAVSLGESSSVKTIKPKRVVKKVVTKKAVTAKKTTVKTASKASVKDATKTAVKRTATKKVATSKPTK